MRLAAALSALLVVPSCALAAGNGGMGAPATGGVEEPTQRPSSAPVTPVQQTPRAPVADAPAAAPEVETPAAPEAPEQPSGAVDAVAAPADGGREVPGLGPVVEQERSAPRTERAKRAQSAQADSSSSSGSTPDLGILSLLFAAASLTGLILAALTARRVWSL
ncbi:MAG: hypothetical protein H0V29_10915 [Thermoleophilaceae bacterium]|nr:hypothetical protein [Thermoleophilaceae bacterium]